MQTFGARVDRNVFRRHFKALLLKRFNVAKRDRVAMVYQLLIPILTIIIALGVVSIPSFVHTNILQFMGHAYFNIPNYVPYNAASSLPGFDYTALGNNMDVVFATPQNMGTVPDYPTMQQQLLQHRTDFKTAKYGALFFNGSIGEGIGNCGQTCDPETQPYCFSDNCGLQVIAFANITAVHGMAMYAHSHIHTHVHTCVCHRLSHLSHRIW